jgi:hypothetical protein
MPAEAGIHGFPRLQRRKSCIVMALPPERCNFARLLARLLPGTSPPVACTKPLVHTEDAESHEGPRSRCIRFAGSLRPPVRPDDGPV